LPPYPKPSAGCLWPRVAASLATGQRPPLPLPTKDAAASGLFVRGEYAHRPALAPGLPGA
jgi:hypothetical protein